MRSIAASVAATSPRASCTSSHEGASVGAACEEVAPSPSVRTAASAAAPMAWRSGRRISAAYPRLTPRCAMNGTGSIAVPFVRTSKCRWQPLDAPVLPTAAIV